MKLENPKRGEETRLNLSKSCEVPESQNIRTPPIFIFKIYRCIFREIIRERRERENKRVES